MKLFYEERECIELTRVQWMKRIMLCNRDVFVLYAQLAVIVLSAVISLLRLACMSDVTITFNCLHCYTSTSVQPPSLLILIHRSCGLIKVNFSLSSPHVWPIYWLDTRCILCQRSLHSITARTHMLDLSRRTSSRRTPNWAKPSPSTNRNERRTGNWYGSVTNQQVGHYQVGE